MSKPGPEDGGTTLACGPGLRSWFKAVKDGEDVSFMAGSHVRRCSILEYWWQVPRVCKSRRVKRVHLLNCERQIGLGISLFPCQFVNCFPQLPGASRFVDPAERAEVLFLNEAANS